MSTVTFRDGYQVSDQAGETNTLVLGGHRTHFVPALQHAVTVAAEAKGWASDLGAIVFDGEYSSKEYALGTTVPTGSSKSWATITGATVNGSEYSAKEYAIGNVVPQGSAKTNKEAAVAAANAAAASASNALASENSVTASKNRVETIYSELQGGGDVTVSFIRFNPNLIDEDITFPTNYNGVSAGDIGIALNKTVTVTEGSTWSVV